MATFPGRSQLVLPILKIVAILFLGIGAEMRAGAGELAANSDIEDEIQFHSGLFAELQKVNADDAVAHARRAVTLLKEQREQKRAADLLIRLGDFLLNNGRIEDALFSAREALVLSEDVAYGVGISKSHILAGTLKGRQGELKEALIHGTEAQRAALPLEDKQYLANAYTLMAIVKSMIGDFGEAEALNLKAIAIHESTGNTRALASSYNNLGIVCYKRLDFRKALEYYERTLETFQELNDEGQVARSLNNIGVVHLDLKEYDDARKYFQESLELKREYGEPREIAHTLANLGQINMAQQNFEMALDYYQKANVIHTEQGNKHGLALISKDLGKVYRQMGQHSRARTELKRALEQSQTLGLNSTTGVILQELSVTHEALGDLAAALDYYRRYKIADDAMYAAQREEIVTQMRLRQDWEGALLELEALREQRLLQEKLIKRDRNLRYAYGISALLLALLLASVMTSYRTHRRIHSSLQESHEKLQESHTKLQKANDTLLLQRDELAKAAATIKTLNELLPICANCKRIRDEEGSWHRIETYLNRDIGKTLTHGICPNCVQELYGDLAADDLDETD